MTTVTLSQEQRAAVESAHQWTWIAAVPGAGKTMVLAHRIVHLISSGVPAEEILALVFTRAAAATLAARVESLLPGARVAVMTYHQFAADLVVPGHMRVATPLESDAAVRSMVDGPLRRRGCRIGQLREAIAAYEATGLCSYDVDTVLDRLVRAKLVPLWELVPELLRVGPPGYRHIILDECQDLTPLELAVAAHVFIKAAVRYGPVGAEAAVGGTIAGDIGQAIMGWRGAEGIKGEGPTHHLSRTYRFGPTLANLASSISGRDIESDPSCPDTQVVELGGGEAPGTRPDLVLCRRRVECDQIARDHDDLEVAWPDLSDPWMSPADRFQAIWDRGHGVVSTIHAAKGSEADHVWIPSAWDTSEPEEKRVLYVAVTRARRCLWVPRFIAR